MAGGTAAIVARVAAAPLTPELALDYLGELSADIRAAVLLDAGGAVAAATEDGAQAERMRDHVIDLFERAERADDGEVGQLEVATGTATVYAVRRGGWTIAVVANRTALASLMFYDLRHVLDDLG